MADFNKRIFGSDIDPKIKNKLIARQILADGSNVNPNESVQFTEVGGRQINLAEAIGKHNFSNKDSEMAYLHELSSRSRKVFGKILGSPTTYERTFRQMRTDGLIKVSKKDKRQGEKQQTWILKEISND